MSDVSRDNERGPGSWTRIQLTHLQQLASAAGHPYVYVDFGDGHAFVRRVLEENGPMRLGRDPRIELPIEHDPALSRQHALLEHVYGNVYVTDLGSSNGTFVDGVRIESDKRTRLRDRSKLRLGPETIVHVRIPVVDQVALTRRVAPEPDWSTFAPRERRVIIALLDLCPADSPDAEPSTAAIGEHLGLQPSSVKNLLPVIYDKLGPHGVSRHRSAVAEIARRYEDSLRAVHEDS